MTKELIWAIDADTPSDMLVYTVLHTDADAGYVERVTYPSRPIDTFTQAELMKGLIAYVHRGNGNSFIDIHYTTQTLLPFNYRLFGSYIDLSMIEIVRLNCVFQRNRTQSSTSG